jgi:MFS family permease
VNRVGVKPALVVGMTALTAGLVFFTQVSVGGSYFTDLLPGFLLIGVGLGFSFVPISIAALAGVQPAEAGLASGLINTSQQIGGALGIAALSAIATSTTSTEVSAGTTPAVALTNGFTAAFIAGGIVAFAGILVALFVVRGRDLEEVPEVQPAFEQAA